MQTDAVASNRFFTTAHMKEIIHPDVKNLSGDEKKQAQQQRFIEARMSEPDKLHLSQGAEKLMTTLGLQDPRATEVEAAKNHTSSLVDAYA